MTFYLSQVINDEELLDFALFHINNNDKVHEVAENIVVAYIIKQWKIQDKEYTEEDIVNEFNLMVVNYTVTQLVNKGLVNVNVGNDGEFIYEVSEEAKKRINNGS